jgi:hypothetical protein
MWIFFEYIENDINNFEALGTENLLGNFNRRVGNKYVFIYFILFMFPIKFLPGPS